MSVEKKALVAAAKEMNKVMGLEPRIDIKAGEEELIEKILEATEFMEDDDELSQATLDTIAALRDEAGDDDYEDDDDLETTDPPDDDDDDEIQEEEPEPEPEPAPAPEKKGKGGKGKKDKDAAPAAEPPAAPKKRGNPNLVGGPRKFGETFTRANASGTVMRAAKSPITIDEITKQANALYVKKTGNASNPKEARWATTIALQALIGYGVIEYNADAGTLSNKK